MSATDRPIKRVSRAEWEAGLEALMPIQRMALSSLDEPNYITLSAIMCLDNPQDVESVRAAWWQKHRERRA